MTRSFSLWLRERIRSKTNAPRESIIGSMFAKGPQGCKWKKGGRLEDVRSIEKSQNID